MSSYRSYMPWKSSLSGTYKSGTSSAYSSRDNISTSDGLTTRFGSIGTPSAFRPSYSGGTYRSIPIKRDTITPSTSYVNRYGSAGGSAGGSTSKDDKNKSTESINKTQQSNTQQQQQKYAGSSSNKENSSNQKISRLSTSVSNLSKYGRKSRDPSPASTDRRTTTANVISRVRSREPSPAVSTLRGRSRDPSPSESLLKGKLSSNTSPSSYTSSPYRLGSRIGSGYGTRLGNSPSGSTALPRSSDTALSYMSSCDIRARSVQKSKEGKDSKQDTSSINDSSSGNDFIETDKSQTSTSENTETKTEPEIEILIPVDVVTRATSPTPPGATSFTRSRRIEIAKTIEKTIQRSTKRPECYDKEIQSDRLDDPTRYSRFSGAARAPSGIPWSSSSTENKYGNSAGRYSSSPSSHNSVRTSNSSQSRSDVDAKEDSKKESINSSSPSSKINSNSNTSNRKLEKSKNSSDSLKSKSSSIKQQIPTLSKQTSSSGSPSSRSLPPVIPKAESPVKSSSTSNASAKWLNKDFRKSALNIGPTDRPRKSRTPSTGTDTEDKPEVGKPLNNTSNSNSNLSNQFVNRIERSPSVGSETSIVSTTASTSSSSNENDSAAANKEQRHQRKLKVASTPTSSTTTSGKHQNVKGCFIGEQESLSSSMAIGYNKNIGSGGHNNYIDDLQNVSYTGGDHDDLQQQPPCKFNRNLSTKRNSPVDSSSVTKNDEAKSFLIRKLGSVSNFFIERAQESDEMFYLDNSSGNSLSDGLKQDVTLATTTSTVSVSQQLNNPIDITTTVTPKTPPSTINTTTNLGSTKTGTGSDLDESSWWLDTSQQIDTESALDIKDEMKFKLRHIDSGEIAWWMRNDNTHDDDNDNTIAENLNSFNDNDHSKSENMNKYYYNNNNNNSNINKNSNNSNTNSSNYGEKSWWSNENDENNSKNKIKYKISHCESGEKAWWLQNEANDESNKENNFISGSGDHQKQPQQPQESEIIEKTWWPKGNISKDSNKSNNSSSPQNLPKTSDPPWLKKEKSNTPSNESSWWGITTDDNVDQYQQQQSIPFNNNSNNNSYPNSGLSPTKDRFWWMNSPTKKLSNIRSIQSGERAWWLQDDPLENSNQQQQQQKRQDQQQPNKNESESSDDDDDELDNVNYNQVNRNYLERPPPLGDRASPEGLEDPLKGRKSPYSNIPSSYNQKIQNSNKQKQNCFISRHTNIDELLGGSCRPLSPLMDRFAGKNMFLEEITPAQVRIHDSTAKMPYIQRVERDEWDYSTAAQIQQKPSLAAAKTPERQYGAQSELDDAALQVYKDGDYGAYLDLESSLAEQAEEIEGLNSSRKNSLVVRTQLSVRVHAIIEKLLSSEGSELRRALFSLKQIFQEDKDLVHGFVALGGLNCLVRVGNGADQNYQNYILRALGQVMLYVDGMNGVMKHGPTIQWLYSLIASKYRLVVKTALKLLLVFVEYVESNCYLLVNAVHSVDNAQGTLPWSNIMKLLKDYDNADTELLIYATSLMNKTLAGLSDQDSFYDESDFLEQQGMEGVIQRYMSRPGTDLDLLDQLQLYEAVLKFEDGETDGIRLPDNSVRKTLRYRSSTDSKERRKSRRHSTGTSPSIAQNNTVIKNRCTPPTHGTLDEDSSSSTNSNEFNVGVFRECKGQREGAGVTPGLRRRRERAERQKTFMKEQEAAAANGLRSHFEKKDEFNGLGQIVTAIPVHLQNGNDSNSGSYSLNNEKLQNSIDNGMQNNSRTTSLNTTTTVTTTATVPCSSPIAAAAAVAGKSFLSNTSISVISNGFDRRNSNGNNLSSEFIASKSVVMKSNATVMNGLLRNINRSETRPNIHNNSNNNNNSNNSNNNNSNGLSNETNETNLNYSNHKKFETESNRLNAYYSQLSSTRNNLSTTSTTTTTLLNQKNVNGNLENSNKLLQVTGNGSNGNQSYSNGIPVINTTNCNGRALNKQKDIASAQFVTCGSGGNNNNNSIGVDIVSNSGGNIVSNNNNNNNTSNNNNNCHSATIPPTTAAIVMQTTLTNGNCNGNTAVTNGNTLLDVESENDEKRLLLQIKRDHTVKDLTQKLSNLPTSPQDEKPQNGRIGDMTGLISKAKEGLAKSKSKGDISRSPSVDQEIKKPEPKKSENELHWEELVRNLSRPLMLCDLDFTDLSMEDEKDVLAPRGLGGAVPPPPPPIGIPPPLSGMGPPPPIMNMPPPPTNLVPPPMFNHNTLTKPNSNQETIKKNKKTVKLFWKEVREDMIPPIIGKTIWDELPKTAVDIQKLEHLFESRAKDLMTKKQQEMNKNKEIIVLDHKRSNAINIAMTKLPPPRAIKAAILKMDATVVTREGIDKLLNMLPTEEERGKIQEAQMSNPELPLGSAEQFLLTLSSISELAARLKLWAFKLDFENSEREIAEPLMDLKQGLELLKTNKTFKCILSTLLSVGIFLNGAPVKGFQIEYLAKVPEVKDTVHKHSLLHHLCHMVMETSPDTTDLYSEIGPITRASKADFTELAHNLVQLETECKASWDRLKLIAKHDCPIQLKQKLVDFLADCAERIITLQIIHRRVINRYRKFLLWLGVPQHRVAESRPNEFCRIVSEFALEYRTTRERVHQQIEKKANHRERNKTRGKMIIDVGKFRSQEDRADAELKQLLGSPNPSNENPDGTLTWRRRRAENLRSPIIKQNEENFTDGDDEILESLVKTATKAPGHRPTPRERKRTRHADRKSLRRTLKNGLTEEEKQHVASLIQTY